MEILGDYLHAQKTLTLMPGLPGIVPITFNPIRVGAWDGSLVLNSELSGEFWYKISVNSATPQPKSLRTMECELGKLF